MFLLIISFIGGALTVLAPCILPLLPVIVGRSLSDNHLDIRKTFTITISLGISVLVFTYLLKISTLFISVPQSVWMWISGGIILVFGIVTLFPSLWESQWLAAASARSNIVLGRGEQKHSITGDIIVGAALGPVFSTCSPTYFIVLATVLPQSLFVGTLYLFSYTIGLCLTLLIVALVGQRILTKLNVAADPDGWFKKTLGILFILVGLAIITGADKKIEAKLLSAGFFDVTQVEQKLLEKRDASNLSQATATSSASENSQHELAGLETSTTSPSEIARIKAQKSQTLKLAPEISTPDGFVNTNGQPITLKELRGKKVVLLDIWTYSCINCQRTIPYLNAWYKKYKDQGLEIVGLHTPEFSFEKVLKNVQNTVGDLGIHYPIVLDNDFSTWNAYGNSYWPRKYLIDLDGYIVYDHIGEGGYEETEQAIVKALAELHARTGTPMEIGSSSESSVNAISVDSSKVASPEVYFGSARNEYLANGPVGSTGLHTFIRPTNTNKNGLYLVGQWNIVPEYAENNSDASVIFTFEAKNVYMVASAESPTDVEIFQDGKKVNTITIGQDKLYNLIHNTDYGVHTLEIKVSKPGLKAFTFTFG
jgi:cytochrome c biogenesis protein CcdA/thiol-disulfide isomerase/thioredoxin